MKVTEEQVELMLKQFLDERLKMVEKLTIVDFDCWISGFIAGNSCCESDMRPEDYSKLIQYLVASEQAKRCGVTGTKLETFKTFNIK